MIYGIGLVAFSSTAVVLGVVMYANMFDCDPFTTGQIRKLDQVYLELLKLTSFKPAIVDICINEIRHCRLFHIL